MNTKLEYAKSELAKATKRYQDCDAENRWHELRIQVQAWQAEVDKLETDKTEKAQERAV